jgi:hypothetical protein
LKERGRQQGPNPEERSLLSNINVERRKGAYLLIMKEGFSFVREEVSNDISFFVF